MFRDKWKVRMFIRAGLYPTSQEIHVKQGAGRYFHITSFNGRVIHWDLSYLGKIYHHSEILIKYRPFQCNSDHKLKNINHLSKMVDNSDLVAALNIKCEPTIIIAITPLWWLFSYASSSGDCSKEDVQVLCTCGETLLRTGIRFILII